MPLIIFRKKDNSEKALDILLLTQGWIGYHWNDIINNKPKITYNPEPGFIIKGRVSNLLNKPVTNSSVLLVSTGKYHAIMDTTTDNDGRFNFDKLPLIMDSTKFVLTARNKKDKTINAGITVDEQTAGRCYNII